MNVQTYAKKVMNKILNERNPIAVFINKDEFRSVPVTKGQLAKIVDQCADFIGVYSKGCQESWIVDDLTFYHSQMVTK